MGIWKWCTERESLINFDQFVELRRSDLTIYGMMPNGNELVLNQAATEEESATMLGTLAEIVGAVEPKSVPSIAPWRPGS